MILPALPTWQPGEPSAGIKFPSSPSPKSCSLSSYRPVTLSRSTTSNFGSTLQTLSIASKMRSLPLVVSLAVGPLSMATLGLGGLIPSVSTVDVTSNESYGYRNITTACADLTLDFGTTWWYAFAQCNDMKGTDWTNLALDNCLGVDTTTGQLYPQLK